MTTTAMDVPLKKAVTETFPVASAVFLVLLIIWTTIGNTIIIIAIVKYKRLQSNSNYLIANLAFSDLFLALTVMPLSATTDLVKSWIFGKFLCPAWLIIDILLCTASVWNLVVIAIDRFTATTFPVWYRSKNKNLFTFVFILTVWVSAIIISLPGLLLSEIINSDGKEIYIENTKGINECRLFDKKTYVIYSALGSFIVPLILMIILYAKIFFVLNARSKHLRARQKVKIDVLSNNTNLNQTSSDPSNTEAEPSNKTKQKQIQTNQERDNERVDSRERRATKQMALIIFFFALCWIPFTLMYIIRAFYQTSVHENWRQLITWLGYANSGLNPILLIIFNMEIRSSFVMIITCDKYGHKIRHR